MAEKPPIEPRRPAAKRTEEGWFRYDPTASDLGRSGSRDDFSDLSGIEHDWVEPQRRRPRIFGFILVAIIFFAIGAGVGFTRMYFTDGEMGPATTVRIVSGDSLDKIATRLQEKRVVRHAGAFIIRVQVDRKSALMKPGRYVLHQNEPYESLVAKLIAGPPQRSVKVTLSEGLTIAQSAEKVAAKVPAINASEYVDVARDNPPPVNVTGYKAGTMLEGLLFPATYDVSPETQPKNFVNRQLIAFDRTMSKIDMRRARKANLTPYDVVIIASLIEREAQVDGERRLVSAVIYNRLRMKMRLQIDATIQYALGKNKPVLTHADLKVQSPYNTYTHSGLPPTPIANPGAASLRAAANPAAVDYVYYVARADGTGRHYFSRTYGEFEANVRKAQQNAQ